MKKRTILNLIIIIIWMILIFLFSQADAIKSTEQSDAVIIKTAEIIKKEELTKEEKEEIIPKYMNIVRKSAHFFLYFILAILIFVFVYRRCDLSIKTVLITLFICLLYATSDELHQLFVSGRSGELRDICIDGCGSLLGELLISLLMILKNKIKEKKTIN